MTGTPRQPIVMVSSRRADSTARQSVKGTESIDTTSCSEFVLVNEATQDVAPSHASEVAEGSGRIRRRVRRSEAEAAVRPARVVVSDILAENVFKVTPTEYERPVQALPPDSSHPTLGEGVRSRRPERGEEDPRTFGREDRIEAPGVLGVPITDEDAKMDHVQSGRRRGSEPAG